MQTIFLNENNIKQQIDDELEIMAQVEKQYILTPNDIDLTYLCTEPGIQKGEPLPWTNDLFYLRPGELTVWGGINGHGKSLLLNQIILWRLKNQKALIASLEMYPDQTLYRMICQYAGCIASLPFAQQTKKLLTGRLWIYDQLDCVDYERILALCHLASKKLNVDHIVIDSLSKCGIDVDDYGKEKKFIDRLQNAAKRYRIHIHLVCHIRKQQDESTLPSKFDIRGHGSITDIADNVIIFWRNKAREKVKIKIKNNFSLSEKEKKEMDFYDAIFSIQKNRHGGAEGNIGLYFLPCGQYSRSETKTLFTPFQ